MTSTTAAQLRNAYPGAAGAVEWCDDPRGDVAWELYRAVGLSPAQVAERLRDAARRTLAAFPGGLCAQVLEQMGHPDFLRFVAAKLETT